LTESNIGLTVGPEYGGPEVCCPLTSSAVVACCCVEDADFIFCGEEAVDVEIDTGGDGAKPTTAFGDIEVAIASNTTGRENRIL